MPWKLKTPLSTVEASNSTFWVLNTDDGREVEVTVTPEAIRHLGFDADTNLPRCTAIAIEKIDRGDLESDGTCRLLPADFEP